jgi:uncharacterized membrane protein YbaN (DUF454 family)
MRTTNTDRPLSAKARPEGLSELPLARSRSLRILMLAVGTLFVGLGILGLILPLLPGTPFLLIAAFCYARASERFYRWLLSNRLTGPSIRSWREHRALPRRVKPRAIGAVLLAFTLAELLVLRDPALRIAFAVLGLFVVALIWRLPEVDDHSLESLGP